MESILVKENRKIFVIDTSVLVYHEDSIHAFPESDVIIPMEVLEEIDTLKARNDSVGNSARYINRFLDEMREKGSLKDGVTLENGQTLSVEINSDLSVLPSGMPDTNDNRIISVAVKLNSQGKPAVLISRDINVRVKCDSLGVPSENYHKEKAVINRKGAYTGVSVLYFSPDEIESFYENKCLEYNKEGLYPNEFLVLKGGRQSALAIHNNGVIRPLKNAGTKGFNIQGVSPRNKEQAFAMESILDPNIHMATLTGRAGSGKTLLSTAAAIHMLDQGIYLKTIASTQNRNF